MFSLLSDTLRTAFQGSKPKHQRLSYEEWEHRFLPHGERWITGDKRRFDRNRDLW